jgi:hypothetical protein
MGRKIEILVFPVTAWWSAIFVTSMLLVMMFYRPTGNFYLGRAIGWFLIYTPLIPGGILTIISWFFPHVRVYHCRHCGLETEVLLKAGPELKDEEDN